MKKYYIIVAGLTWILWEYMGPVGVVLSSPYIGMVIAYKLTRDEKSEYY